MWQKRGRGLPRLNGNAANGGKMGGLDDSLTAVRPGYGICSRMTTSLAQRPGLQDRFWRGGEPRDDLTAIFPARGHKGISALLTRTSLLHWLNERKTLEHGQCRRALDISFSKRKYSCGTIWRDGRGPPRKISWKRTVICRRGAQTGYDVGWPFSRRRWFPTRRIDLA